MKIVCEEKSEQKNIEANDVTIQKYLENSIEIIIPRYQREYSWDQKNINILIKDLKKDYYIGNIIEYSDPEGLKKEIVDGQQRTITIFLILIVLKHLIKDENIKQEILNLVSINGKCKLDLKNRIASSGSDILDFFIDDAELPKELQKEYNEIQMYKYIKKELSKYSDVQLIDLFDRIKSSILIEISFSNSEMAAHEMFVNVNTKGRPLDKIEILKSQLFKFLSNPGLSDEYKEKWHVMLEKVPKKDYDTFCNDVYLFNHFKAESGTGKYTTSGTVNENSIKLIDSINSNEKAKDVFAFMTGFEKTDILPVYSAVKKYEISKLSEDYFKNVNASFENLDRVWKMYKEIGFKQSDIMFVSLLLNKENFLNREINYLCTFIQYMYMFELCRSFMNISPANYSNGFKQASALIYNCQDNGQIKEILKKFIENLSIDEKKLKESLSTGNVTKSKSKTLKLIVMMAEDIFASNLSLEHFIFQKTDIEEDKEYVWKIGNLIPVINDKYGSKSVEIKLKFYNEDKESDIGIKNFLEYQFTKDNYKEKIKERTEKIIEQFLKKMSDCRNIIMEG